MKKVFAGILALGSLAFAGCGPTAEDVIGTWTWAEGSGMTIACEGMDPLAVDYSGGTMTFAAGAEHDLIIDGGDCDGAYSFDGGVIKADGTEGTCETVEDDGSTTVEGEFVLTYSMEGDVATLTPSGEVKTTTTIEGMDPLVCTSSYDAGSKATK